MTKKAVHAQERFQSFRNEKKTKIDAIVLFREYFDNLAQCVGAGLGSD